MTADTPARQPQDDSTCKTCCHPTCMQRTTTSNAYKVCTVRVAHTSPPAPDTPLKSFKTETYRNGFRDGAKAAREQFASELIEKIEKYLDEREQPKCVVLSLQMVEKLIKKSLRAQQQQGVSEG